MNERTEGQELPLELTVQLRRPIAAHGEQVNTITMRAPTIGDLKDTGFGAGGRTNPGGTIALVAKLAGIPPSSVETILLADLSRIQDAISDFLGESGKLERADRRRGVLLWLAAV